MSCNLQSTIALLLYSICFRPFVQLVVMDPLSEIGFHWVQVRFINSAASRIGAEAAYAHGVHLVLLDGIGLGVGMPPQVSATPVVPAATCCRNCCSWRCHC